jgi:hypothetical protein
MNNFRISLGKIAVEEKINQKRINKKNHFRIYWSQNSNNSSSKINKFNRVKIFGENNKKIRLKKQKI